jgi:demethylmenaquinone methyltransferase/2-methoxy-6-polyprenyl-1,4-benzoquinol methylase
LVRVTTKELPDTEEVATEKLNTDSSIRERARRAYDKHAGAYDRAVPLYSLVGMRVNHWRRIAVDALDLQIGDTVVEVGCGTGLNFQLLERRIGHSGRVIGFDISEAMLEHARARVAAEGWENVELINVAAVDFEFPQGIAGILATGVLTYEPEFDQVIGRGVKALAPGRRWVVLDYKMPSTWQRIFAPVFIALGATFGVSKSLMDHNVWESIERHLENVRTQDFYGGFVYLSQGDAPRV